MTGGNPGTPVPPATRDERAAGSVAASAAPATVSSAQLLDGADELRIDHDGTVYRLRRTALGKLILTK